jgi:hypothetical protein
MLERQLSGLFRHCSDVPGDIALGQPALLSPCIVFHGDAHVVDARFP